MGYRRKNILLTSLDGLKNRGNKRIIRYQGRQLERREGEKLLSQHTLQPVPSMGIFTN